MPRKAHLAGGTKSAAHAAAGLRRDAGRPSAVLVRHQYTFNNRAVPQFVRAFNRAVPLRYLLRSRTRDRASDGESPCAHVRSPLRRQVRHVAEIVDALVINPLP